MDGSCSSCMGLMAVVAVSSSVALVALQLHRRLASDFMKKIELELRGQTSRPRTKKVRFADNVVEPSANNVEYRRRRSRAVAGQASPVREIYL